MVGRDLCRPSGVRQVDSVAAWFTACTSRHSFSDTIRNAGASRRTTASGDCSVTDVPRRLVCRVLPHTLTPAYVSLARIEPTWVGDHSREPRGEATPSRSSSLAILK